MKVKNIMSNNSFKLLKDTADNILKEYLKKSNEDQDFHNFRRWIINEIVDKHNTKLPMDCVIGDYNYCIEKLSIY